MKISPWFFTALITLSLGPSYGLSSAASGPNVTPVSVCGERPDLFRFSTPALSLAQLPMGVYVGRLAEIWIESKDGSVKLHARHNFKTGQKEFVCANFPESYRGHFSTPLLALFDQTKEHRTGNAVWQFQLMVKDSRLGLWNRKSGLMTAEDVLRKPASSGGIEFNVDSLDDYRSRSKIEMGDIELLSVVLYDRVVQDPLK